MTMMRNSGSRKALRALAANSTATANVQIAAEPSGNSFATSSAGSSMMAHSTTVSTLSRTTTQMAVLRMGLAFWQ